MRYYRQPQYCNGTAWNMKPVWLALGIFSLGSGIVGIFLPILPTVPFVLLAAFCFSRSSDRLHNWLVEHPDLGPHIIAWRERGAIGEGSKRMATLSIIGVVLLSVAFGVAPFFLAIQVALLAAVLVFIWTRPDK